MSGRSVRSAERDPDASSIASHIRVQQLTADPALTNPTAAGELDSSHWSLLRSNPD